jgi:hypothetical protein
MERDHVWERRLASGRPFGETFLGLPPLLRINEEAKRMQPCRISLRGDAGTAPVDDALPLARRAS